MHQFGAMEGYKEEYVLRHQDHLVYCCRALMDCYTGACPLELCWDRESRLIAESIEQGNTLFVFCLLVDYCLCVGHFVGSCCGCHTGGVHSVVDCGVVDITVLFDCLFSIAIPFGGG